jgi:tRNA dimethylallyltransferase
MVESRHNGPVLIIAGPTASGKSALALELATGLGGTVINADALQVYRDLRILTARPDEAAEARVPHRLYGTFDAAERGSAGRWRELAEAEIAAAQAVGRLAIVVGGTGLYLRILREGLAPVPDIPSEIRDEAVSRYRVLGGAAFRAELARFDREAAERLPPADRHRLIRAWEVVRATGVSLRDWQRRGQPIAARRFATILLMPQREALYAACNARLAGMIAGGGLEEAAALMARRLPPTLPAMKAVGLPELMRHLRGEMPLADAVAAAQQATRRYAKRQTTWFRHQMAADLIFAEQFSESLLRRSRHFIDDFLLTHTA